MALERTLLLRMNFLRFILMPRGQKEMWTDHELPVICPLFKSNTGIKRLLHS